MSEPNADQRIVQMTINGKKVELPIKRIISGQSVIPSATLANPESLKFFERFARIEELEAQGKGMRDVQAKL